MRYVLLLCGLCAVAADARAQAAPPRTSAGVRIGVGGLGLPGWGIGTVPHFGGVVERTVTRRDSLVAGMEYQRVPDASYFDEPGRWYTGSLASAFVGYKSRIAGTRSGVYASSTLGVTRWSGRPGDVGWTPSIGALFGADLAVRSRSKVFAEIGTRFGKPTSVAAIPRWSFGLGYATGF